MGEEEAETWSSNFSFQVLLKTHPEKLGGIRQFKMKNKFYFVVFKMTDGTACLYADGNGRVKVENCTTGKGKEIFCVMQYSEGKRF